MPSHRLQSTTKPLDVAKFLLPVWKDLFMHFIKRVSGHMIVNLFFYNKLSEDKYVEYMLSM